MQIKMNKKTTLTIVGVAAIIIGSGAMWFAGSTESQIGGLVAAVFLIAGVIAGFFK